MAGRTNWLNMKLVKSQKNPENQKTLWEILFELMEIFTEIDWVSEE